MPTTTFTSRAKKLDPLLTAARILLWVLLAGVALSFAATALALVLELVRTGAALPFTAAWDDWAPTIGLALALLALLIIAKAAWRLLQMVETVPAGEAFSLPNVRRLEEIAGLILGLQLIGLTARMLRVPFGGDVNGFDISVSLSPGGVAVVLLLFILARIFRQGLAMRADLEGTV